MQIVNDLDAFYSKSVDEANDSFWKFYNVKAAFLADLANPLRESYTNFELAVARFPFDRLTPETFRSFKALVNSVTDSLEKGVSAAENAAVTYFWLGRPKSPVTPSEEYLKSTMWMSIDLLKFHIGLSIESCLEPFIPKMIPSYQPAVAVVVNAALNKIANPPAQEFPNSIRTSAESREATSKFIKTLDNCAHIQATETCIKNFVSFHFYSEKIQSNLIFKI